MDLTISINDQKIVGWCRKGIEYVGKDRYMRCRCKMYENLWRSDSDTT